jgi:hypothetical protein
LKGKYIYLVSKKEFYLLCLFAETLKHALNCDKVSLSIPTKLEWNKYIHLEVKKEGVHYQSFSKGLRDVKFNGDCFVREEIIKQHHIFNNKTQGFKKYFLGEVSSFKSKIEKHIEKAWKDNSKKTLRYRFEFGSDIKIMKHTLRINETSKPRTDFVILTETFYYEGKKNEQY